MMWKVSVCLMLVAIHVNHIRANTFGWGSGDSSSNQGSNAQSNSGRDTSITSSPPYGNSPGKPTNENYWWLTANPFQKPPNHPGVEKGALSSGSTAPGPSNSNYGNPVPSSGSYNKFPANQQNSPSYSPSSNFQAQPIPQRPKPVPQYQQNLPSQNTGSYGGSSPSGNGWNGASNSGSQPQAQAPIKITQNYRPPDTDFGDCQLTNKADCHSGPVSAPVINPGYNQVDSPSGLPEIGSSSYTQPKPQAPVPQIPSGGNSYGNSPVGSYSPPAQVEIVPLVQPAPQIQPSYQTQPTPQIQPAPQAQPAPQVLPLPQVKPAPVQVQPSYQAPSSPSSNYNTGWSASSGSPQPKPVIQSQPSYSGPSNQFQSGAAPSVVQSPSRPVQSNSQSFNQNYRPQPQIVPSGNANNNNYAEQLPYPGCPAAMLCVPDNRCNAKGVIEERPITLSAAELQFRVALVACSAPQTGDIGVCCRDPNYTDPWPDMNGNGGNKQHHHHHDDSNKGQGGGGFNPNISQQGASSVPSQQPSNNFNSYSDSQNNLDKLSNNETASVTCQLDEDCIESSRCETNENTSDQSETALQKCKDGTDGVQYVCCPGEQDADANLEIAASQLDLAKVQKINDAVPVVYGDGGTVIDTTQTSILENTALETAEVEPNVPVPKMLEGDSDPKIQEEYLRFRSNGTAVNVFNETESEKADSGTETESQDTTTSRPGAKRGKRIRIKLVSRVGGHPVSRNIQRVGHGSSHNQSNVAAGFQVASHSSHEASDDDLITGKENPNVPEVEDGSTEDAELNVKSRVKITDVPLQEGKKTESVKPVEEQMPKIEFLFPPNSEPLQLPITTPTIASPQLSSLNARKAPNVNKDKIHNQLIIDLETAYKGSSVVAKVQNGTSPFNARSNPIPTLSTPTGVPTTENVNQRQSLIQDITTTLPIFTSTVEIPVTVSTTVETKKTEDRSNSHLYPFFHGTDSPRSFVTSETGEKILVPSQHFETPSLTPEDRLRLIVPPPPPTESEFSSDTDEAGATDGPEEIMFFSPLAASRNIVVDNCPLNMKCLSESYCSTMNPEEGDADAFDIRLHFRKKSYRQRCRQPNLPVNGYCCFLREDFESVAANGTASDLTSRIQKKNSGRHCGVKRPNVQNPKSREEDTTFGEFPWQALILRKDQPSCGGAVLSERLIATSAACVNTTALNDIIIRVGDWDADRIVEPKEHQELSAEVYYVHPGYKTNSLYAINDIAIIRTKENIKFDYHVSRVCLPNAYDKFDGKRCIATGWYTTTPNMTDEADFSVQLKQMSVTITARQICQKKLRDTTLGSRFNLHGGNICAAGDPSLRTCVVEAGGPVICENEQTGSYDLVGIFGWGNACGNSDEVGVYSSIPAHAEWIYSVMQRESEKFL